MTERVTLSEAQQLYEWKADVEGSQIRVSFSENERYFASSNERDGMRCAGVFCLGKAGIWGE